MRATRQHLTLERIRPAAGRLLISIFVLTAQLAPLVHLGQHPNDHTHGLEAADRYEADADHGHDHGDWCAENGYGEAADHDRGVPSPPDVVARWHHAPALPQPPARGPPRSH